MGEGSIRIKLNRELEEGKFDECHVIYILSRVRKILEINEVYNELRFYCNWSLHPHLYNPNTIKPITERFEDIIRKNVTGKEIANEMIKEYSDFFEFNLLKVEILSFLSQHDLHTKKLERFWNQFVVTLLNIIEDTPIICENSQNIKEMRIVRDKNKNFCYRFSLRKSKEVAKVKLKFK